MIKKGLKELKKGGKKLETFAREVRDEVTVAVNEKILEKATKDYRNDANTRADDIKRLQDAVAVAIHDSQSKWEELFKNEHFPSDTTKDFIREKLSGMSNKFVSLTTYAAQVEQQRQNIIARPSDGSSSATNAQDECAGFLTTQQVAADDFATLHAELQKEMAVYNQARERIAADIKEHAEFATLAEAALNNPLPAA